MVGRSADFVFGSIIRGLELGWFYPETVTFNMDAKSAAYGNSTDSYAIY